MQFPPELRRDLPLANTDFILHSTMIWKQPVVALAPNIVSVHSGVLPPLLNRLLSGNTTGE